MNKEKTHFFDKKENVKKTLYLLYFFSAVLLVTDFFIHRHVIHSWESIPGFYALFGFIACTVLVLAATQMRKLVMRKEDYYEAEPDDSTSNAVTDSDTSHVDD